MKFLQFNLFNKKHYLLSFFLCCLNACFLAPTFANNANFKFRQISTPEGLSQSYVFDIVQDKNGFLWFATADGLNRYDGFEFVHYRRDIDNPNSIADNYIRTLFIDSKDNLWVGTRNGLSQYKASSNSFTNFFHQEGDANSLSDNTIWDIYEGKNNELLVSTALGVHRFDQTSGKFTRLKIKNFAEAFKQVKTIFQDENEDYWLGTFENGIYITNQSLSLAKQLNVSTATTAKWNFTIDANALYDIKFIGENYWLATDNGVFVLDKNYQLIKHLNKNNTQRLTTNNIRAIQPLSEQYVWLGSDKGLYSIDILTFDIAPIFNELTNNGSFSVNWIMSSYKDTANNIWIGTYGGGLQLKNAYSNLFESGPTSSGMQDRWLHFFTETSNNTIWFNNELGELYKESATGELTHIKLPIEVAQVHKRDAQNIWLKSYNQALYNFDVESNKLTTYQQWLPSDNTLQKLIAVNQYICQISTDKKLSCFDSETQSNASYLPSGETGLVKLAKGSDNQVYLLTDSNVFYRFSLDTREFEFIYSLSEKDYKSFNVNNFAIAQQNLWLSSNGLGIIHIDLKKDKLTFFNEKNSLNNSFIADLRTTPDGALWFATNVGIGVIEPLNLKVKLFDYDFGLNNAEFNAYSSYLTENGLLYFGNPKGYIKFDPSQLTTIRQELVTPVITNLTIANKDIEQLDSYKHQSFSQNLAETRNLAINYKDFPISFDFVSPNVSLPSQTEYRYRLLGLEEQWVQATKANRRATYTNLSPGKYIFEAEVFDAFNPNLTKKSTLRFEILPPWWLSNSAISVYSLAAFLMLVYFIMQFRHRQQYHAQIQKSEERLKLSLWGSGDEMWDWNIKENKIFRSNIWGILEFPQDGKRNVGTEQTNIHPNDIPKVKQALNDHFDKKSEHFETTYRVKSQNEQWFWVLDRGKIVERDDKDQPIRMTGTLKDISHIKKAEERLKLFAKCIENISDAVVIYDRQFNIIDVNKSFVRITGNSKSSMLGKQLYFPLYPESFTQSIKKHLIVNGNWQGEIESKRANGDTYYTELSLDIIRDESRNISHFVGVFSDITDRKKSEVDLRKLANSDTLTGLPNRSYFQANQQRLVKSKIPHALLVFDLDNFKKINDSMGHQVGDNILIEVAKRIVQISSKRNSVYRLGGDEFSIIIENTNDIHTITSLAKDILKLIAIPLKVKSQELVLYSSIGIVLYPEDGTSPQELLKNADTAMYHAKDNGGNRYQFFSDSMNKKAVKRIQIESLIRHGLKEDYFSVFYQPKIEITTGKVAGMEALVRFETPTKGIISPLVFIPVSEETGQIIDIGEVVLRKSCYAAKKWVDAGLFDGRVAVNLSAVQFTQPNLPKMIASILEESQLPAKHLELEITEGTVMDSPQQAIDTMLQIRSMGIHLALDDFGTGYSSLAYLKKFPLNTLKIDKAFVDDIETSEQGRNMVATIVTIAHNLGMQVVAEGVENNNQLHFLSGLACEQLQGYLYSKPLPEAEFQKYLLSHQITDQSTHLLKSK
ncbi:EAL domain-containing protein [Colwellia sp. MEBiC06753]